MGGGVGGRKLTVRHTSRRELSCAAIKDKNIVASWTGEPTKGFMQGVTGI